MQNEFAQFAFAQFAHFCSFLQGKNIITTYVSIHYKTHHCFASKLSKSKLSNQLKHQLPSVRFISCTHSCKCFKVNNFFWMEEGGR